MASFNSFRLKHGLPDTWPPSIWDLVNHVAYMSNLGFVPASVKVYLSGLSYWLRINVLSDLTQSFIIQKMLKSMDKLYGKPDSPKPITLDLLTKLINVLQFVCTSVYESTLYKSMFSLACFAFLQIGEITINTTSRYIIRRDDVYFPQTLLFVNVKIPFSKTDQEGLSTTITITKHTQLNICPVQLLSQFLNVRHNGDGPLFCHFKKNSVTRYQFSRVLNLALQFIGCNPNEYNTHSFRIVAAIHFSMQGISDQEIMSKGRWKSECFKRYIRIDLIN